MKNNTLFQILMICFYFSWRKKFTKLDLSQEYAQLELNENLKPYWTVNTHVRLFRYKRLTYEVSSAPEIFQSVMDKVLTGLAGVVCRIEDVLITA